MNTPIFDFVKEYTNKNISRFHMPGHKGKGLLGCETYDITEVAGADALYEADGIIAESEQNATELFGTGRTLYSTEGSSQCIRSMLYLAVNHWKSQPDVQAAKISSVSETKPNDNARPYIIAARNVHKAFLYAAALIDFDVVWLYPEEIHSLCSCHISPKQLEDELTKQLKLHKTAPTAVYVTSPDYLGGQLDIKTLADICHKYNTILAVDNAHGSYLHFLDTPMHPIDLGADICCDSAHKTLPVLTGGAYLQISKNAPKSFRQQAKQAMALFGSTSPSYLTLTSLDLCNAYLADDYKEKLADTVETLEKARTVLRENSWTIENTDPLKLTIRVPDEMSGAELADKLRLVDVECEYADSEYVVLMVTPENTLADYGRLFSALGINKAENICKDNNDSQDSYIRNNSTGSNSITSLKPVRYMEKMSIREAIFASHELIPIQEALGRICGTPTVGCPPAIPIVVSGELIDENAIVLFEHYEITMVDVVK